MFLAKTINEHLKLFSSNQRAESLRIIYRSLITRRRLGHNGRVNFLGNQQKGDDFARAEF